ncbi:MAG: tRNA epoxyqueuosine(34) reductase QueG, partial [Nannocystaceae bacterium]|nr:tRNA epoxyqueuosine(34) reductase QueG [Nannocystaceae bacterium]
MNPPPLSASTLAELAAVAAEVGLLRLGAVRLDHPGFDPARRALTDFLADGREGEMEFLRRTAAVRADPSAMLPGARTLLVAAVPYRGEGSAIARYARASDYHTVLHDRLDVVAARLCERLPGAQVLVCVDTKPLLERAGAALAGLGFLGKHGCVIVPGLGSYVLLGGLLTTAPWHGDDAVAPSTDALARVRWDACGSCTRCLDACPTQAFVAPGELDPRRCISYLTIEHRGPIDESLQRAIGSRLFGCDACQEVCPYNAAPDREARVPPAAWLPAPKGPPRTEDPWRIVAMGSATWRAWAKHTPLRRAPRRSMRRNALVVLGNRGEPPDAAQRALVATLCDDDDPELAAAARRLLRRSGDL